MSSITPPKALVPTKMGSNPSRPVLEKGDDRAAKAIRCTTLSLSSGAGGEASNGHSMVIVRMADTTTVKECRDTGASDKPTGHLWQRKARFLKV